MPRDVHLVGSVPLENAEEVFCAVAKMLPGRVKRFSDGETGERKMWVMWQEQSLLDNVSIQKSEERYTPPGQQTIVYQRYEIKPGISPEDVRFGPIGYGATARSSYKTFMSLRNASVLPAGARFLVTFPAPSALISGFIVERQRLSLESAYVKRVEAELDEVLATIPHRDLAIQWDIVHEIMVREKVRPSYYKAPETDLIRRLVHIGDIVPKAVDLGYHLCYGDAGHRHVVEPKDTAVMVDLANEITQGLARPVSYFHMPVPRDRDDAAYFAPLKNLRLREGTELYLGLVHYTDGISGTRRRIESAKSIYPDFGIGTECGFGRRPPETVHQLLKIHAEASA